MEEDRIPEEFLLRETLSSLFPSAAQVDSGPVGAVLLEEKHLSQSCTPAPEFSEEEVFVS